jgi:NitT/TauT family transport system substrate-binding protein
MRIKLSENFRAVFYAPFYATHALGFYTNEGVEVELLNSPAPAAAASGLLDGSIDASWGGPMRVLKARDLDPHAPLVCFCEVVARDPFFLVGKAAGFRLTDLPRLRVATVSEVPTPWLCLQHDLREQGIDPIQVNRVTERTMSDNLKALRVGDLDVVQMFEPYVADGRGRYPLRGQRARADRLHDIPCLARQHSPQPRSVFRHGPRHTSDVGVACRAQRGGTG